MNNPSFITKQFISEFDSAEELVFDNDIKVIENEVFKNNNKIKRITFNGNVDLINFCAFSRCENLESVIFNKNLGTVFSHAFEHCWNLKHLQFNSINTVANYGFAHCCLTEIDLNKINSIDCYSFAENKIKKIVSDRLLGIPTGCFFGNPIEYISIKNCDFISVASLFSTSTIKTCVLDASSIHLDCFDYAKVEELYISNSLSKLKVGSSEDAWEDIKTIYIPNPNTFKTQSGKSEKLFKKILEQPNIEIIAPDNHISNSLSLRSINKANKLLDTNTER